ncbi:MAG: glycosyl hydrolase, partial [Bacteroidota bacterium]
SRADENQWFGAGKDDPFIHSIVVDPRDSDHVYVAVSCAGVFETKDGGQSWQPRNKGLIAAYLPNPNVEVGHDPHRLLMCPSNPDVLWQQNHCGIFRSLDGGQSWKLLSDKEQMPHYGFALAIDEQDTEKAWVIPAVSDEERVAFDLALCVCETADGGRTWKALRKGLPQQHCFDIVFRHAFCKEKQLMAFGSTTGNLYLSEDKGQAWQCLSANLARIDSLVFTS